MIEDEVYALLTDLYEAASYALRKAASNDEKRQLHYTEITQFTVQMKQRMLENGYVKEDLSGETW